MQNASSPIDLHVVTFDFPGLRCDNLQNKPCRWTGIVKHTVSLIQGLGGRVGKLALTQTSAPSSEAYEIDVLGKVALAQGIMTSLPDGSLEGKKPDQTRGVVTTLYEDRINDPKNPLLRSLAEQLTRAIRRANIPNILCQNPNPAVSLLKAEEMGLLDPLSSSVLTAVFVIHDTAGYERRLCYIRDRILVSRIAIKVVAVSQQVSEALRALGFDAVKIIPNGFDVDAFERDLATVRSDSSIYSALAQRNNLPEGQRLILVAARRAPHKGHLDVVEACRLLAARGRLKAVVAFTGASDDQEFASYEQFLRQEIERTGLERHVLMLDSLSALELVALFDRAFAVVHASTEPEGFAYANLEAMLADTPVIASRLGGPLSYIVHGHTGFLVNPGDPEVIAQLLDGLLSDRVDRRAIVFRGRDRARQFSIEAMASGYAATLADNRPHIPARVRIDRRFTFVGEGRNAMTFHRNDRRVVQMFKSDNLTIRQLEAEDIYLREAYAAMPDFVPAQRFCRHPSSGLLTRALLVKEAVVADDTQQPLHLHDQPGTDLCRQMSQFLDITRSLFTERVGNDRMMHYCVPDIIDPPFNNLVVDQRGRLRLLDTNWLMNTRSLQVMVEQGETLDVEQRPIIAALLRRLMLLENRFRGKDRTQLQADPFFAQFLDAAGFASLFATSKADGEPFL